MQENKKIDMVTATNEYFYADTAVFDASQGLKIAVAFTGYDNEQEYALPPEIGELIFQNYQWGPDENGSFRIIQEDLETHVCTDEELGFNDENRNGSASGNFFPIHEESYNVVKLYRKKFLCFNNKDSTLFGDFNS